MPTLRGRVLLGWLSRDQAVEFLLSQCAFDPPIDAAQAEAIWRPFRDRAEALPIRPEILPVNLGLNTQEVAHAKKFRAFLNSRGPNSIIAVKKVNLLELRVYQYHVAIDQADTYRNAAQSGANWLAEALPTAERPSQLTIATHQQNWLHTSFNIAVPHAEHVFQQNPPGVFTAGQLLRHVTIAENGRWAYLHAGYHRCFAKCVNAPAATVPSAVVAVATFTLPQPPPMLNAAPGVVDPGLDTFGVRAAVFADFFTNGLFMDVNLRKKRYELQVRSTWVAIDEP